LREKLQVKAVSSTVFAALLLAIRRDIGIVPADREATFKPMLWASGVDKRAD
jgi:hypothetical protein